MDNSNWYAKLVKPSWAPPDRLFGPVWSVLYIVIFISFGRVFVMGWQNQIPFIVVLPFVLNLIFNAMFTPLQFGLKNNILAAMDILLILGTIIWAVIAIYPYASWIAYAQVPYLIWVAVATCLQLSITRLNW